MQLQLHTFFPFGWIRIRGYFKDAIFPNSKKFHFPLCRELSILCKIAKKNFSNSQVMILAYQLAFLDIFIFFVRVFFFFVKPVFFFHSFLSKHGSVVMFFLHFPCINLIPNIFCFSIHSSVILFIFCLHIRACRDFHSLDCCFWRR